MRNRYKPAALPPSPALIKEYLFDADMPDADTDAERAKAVRALHTLWLRWRAEVVAEASQNERMLLPATMYRQRVRRRWIAEGAPADFDFELRDFFDRAGRVICASSDPPMAALRLFRGHRQRGRGRPVADNADRDGMIAADVQELVNGGASVDEACTAIGGAAALSPERVHQIYYDNCKRLDVLAELQLRELDRRAG